MRGSSVALTVAVPLGAVSLSALPWAVGALLDAVVTGGRLGPAAGWAAGGSAALLALAVSARATPVRTAVRAVAVRTAAVRAVAAGSVVGLAVLSPWLAAAFFAGVLPGVVLVRLFARSTAEFRPARPGPSRGRVALLVASVELTVLGTAGQLAAAGRLSAGACAAAAGWAALGLTPGPNPGPGFRRPAPRLPRAGLELPEGPGELVFRSVLLRDARGAVLLGPLELTVPGGWTVAVVGRPGAGRSLLAALTVGLRLPDGGAVLVDGVPVTALSVAARRRAVGCAFERPRLVVPAPAEAAGPARNGGPHFTGGGSGRPGPDGPTAADPRVMVLDDAARSPAPPADRRTRLVLTRRTAVAAGADLVLWLDGGRARAVGPHADLLADPDYRATLVDAPAGAEAAERCEAVDNCFRAPAN